ncbi:GrpB family protein [Brevibacillus sp. Leaf182]|uniref:GrpB family protein n=1 Tax=Brevibacillus sp. Leaf182 TaxID=1736290 RepID=UPI0009E9D53C|nr:hypothetical protein ASG16_021295 [Brevibacillus sp. Leaf182]
MVEIHHVGSTSVRGLSAKPVIDVLPVVRDIARVDTYNSEMLAYGCFFIPSKYPNILHVDGYF